MPKRTDIHSILVIGAGPIIIGQACEFDYSGTQACKTLRAEGYRVILVNSNPATIMTDPELADATYIEPITKEFITQIIEREKPDALLPTMGGQTALNISLELARDGILEKNGVELIAARQDAIEKAEDRGLFQKTMQQIGLETPASFIAHDMNQAQQGLAKIGLPAIIRPSFTLGGTGGGIASTKDEFIAIAQQGIKASPAGEILIEESVLGWKEFEMEVVRDQADNCIIICSIENIDPMGIHTGDSITVAPALTLTDKEYQMMRNASIACLRAIGVECGGSNVQFAINPKDGRMVIIEMNPRVSRSSALASKATGFPIAKVAAQLAVGYQLDELVNDMTGTTPASFEPVIDYVVTKIPRFAFEKFPTATGLLTTSMQSVGEAMAIGRTFCESLQKALRSLETGLNGLDPMEKMEKMDTAQLRTALARAHPDRLRLIADALRAGMTISEIHEISYIDPWFIAQIEEIIKIEADIESSGLPENEEGWRELKSMGFSDARLAQLTGHQEKEITAIRHKNNVRPVFKRIDSCAAEFRAATSYMYSTYERVCEAQPNQKRKAIILGGGPNRIGQGIEFDYCCCHAAFALREMGVESIMINCNPETISTDYDTSDRLYFEPLTAEDVLEVIHRESAAGEMIGVIVQFGGQTPLKLAHDLEQAGVPVLGTSPDAIDLAEDRERFQKLIQQLDLKQPVNGMASSLEEARALAQQIGYPVMLRPSYVLGGRAMEIVHDDEQLAHYLAHAVRVSQGQPVLIDDYLRDAIEVDVDALGDGSSAIITGIMEHIEEAGVHSGDSACSLPPHSLSAEIIARIEEQTKALAAALRVKGLMNVQYAVLNSELYVIEVNPRASRTVPFVAKAIGAPIVKMAVRLMLGGKISEQTLPPRDSYFAVKEAVFPFARFPNMDTVLGPEMRSTGEVMGLAPDFPTAFAKSQIACGSCLPAGGTAFISVKDPDKPHFTAIIKALIALNFDIMATGGTASFMEQQGLKIRHVNKVRQGEPHIVNAIHSDQVQLIFNTTQGAQSLADSRSLRRAALMSGVPYYTTLAGARAALQAIQAQRASSFGITSLQSRQAQKENKKENKKETKNV